MTQARDRATVGTERIEIGSGDCSTRRIMSGTGPGAHAVTVTQLGKGKHKTRRFIQSKGDRPGQLSDQRKGHGSAATRQGHA